MRPELVVPIVPAEAAGACSAGPSPICGPWHSTAKCPSFAADAHHGLTNAVLDLHDESNAGPASLRTVAGATRELTGRMNLSSCCLELLSATSFHCQTSSEDRTPGSAGADLEPKWHWRLAQSNALSASRG